MSDKAAGTRCSCRVEPWMGDGPSMPGRPWMAGSSTVAYGLSSSEAPPQTDEVYWFLAEDRDVGDRGESLCVLASLEYQAKPG